MDGDHRSGGSSDAAASTPQTQGTHLRRSFPFDPMELRHAAFFVYRNGLYRSAGRYIREASQRIGNGAILGLGRSTARPPKGTVHFCSYDGCSFLVLCLLLLPLPDPGRLCGRHRPRSSAWAGSALRSPLHGAGSIIHTRAWQGRLRGRRCKVQVLPPTLLGLGRVGSAVAGDQWQPRLLACACVGFAHCHGEWIRRIMLR